MNQDRYLWSLSLGRWGSTTIRLHIFFVLFAILTVYFGWLERRADDMWIAVLSVFILLISVTLHEVGHFIAAQRLGGHMDTIVLWPLGGLRSAKVPNDPQSELLVMLAGPLTSLLICLFCFVAASVQDGASIVGLLNPLQPRNLVDEVNLFSFLRLTCWINLWLTIVNLIPAFPFDGGRACVAFLQSVRPDTTLEQAVGAVAMLARIVAILLFFTAIATSGLIGGDPAGSTASSPFESESVAVDNQPLIGFSYEDPSTQGKVPAWLGLALLSAFVFFSASVEESHSEWTEVEEELFGYDFSQGFTSLERTSEPKKIPKPGPFTRWLESRRAQKEAARLKAEQDDDREVDGILARLHEHGMESLSPRERALLKRVSERYRSREEG